MYDVYVRKLIVGEAMDVVEQDQLRVWFLSVGATEYIGIEEK
jgi:hypothetical protein